ncbi:ribonuclease M5 [Peloplasma aerotolerans]|uniref:Ribonuclease M5 n=1 Tax=Peloplasma aerotolerans TaxID=3044389 RepID=A0AAW6U822_9MOLU|nr:ribonuclease M5 [Mariniplasma sp. M4Ah]MDI6452223.1 ribonuclease M5 [Mariniplasma sp. M4Ah]MDR4969031.1 ribonuclease M5 [Acholeplasmataceae bacterium]
MKNQVIVVEGRNDASRLKQIFPQTTIITTNGSAIDENSIEILIELDKTHDIILFLDPDHAGERIRRLLSKKINHVHHAFLDQEKAYSKNKKKIGIEHATDEDIIKALSEMKIVAHESNSDITHTFLYEIKLKGHKDSKNLRHILSTKMKIGYVNGKTLYQRLKTFNIMKQEVIEVLRESSS